MFALLLQAQSFIQFDWAVAVGAVSVLFFLTCIQYWVFSEDSEPFSKAIIRRALMSALGSLSSGALLLPQIAPHADTVAKLLAGAGAAAVWWLGTQFVQNFKAQNAPLPEGAKEVIKAARTEAHAQGMDDLAKAAIERGLKRTLKGAIKKVF